MESQSSLARDLQPLTAARDRVRDCLGERYEEEIGRTTCPTLVVLAINRIRGKPHLGQNVQIRDFLLASLDYQNSSIVLGGCRGILTWFDSSPE